MSDLSKVLNGYFYVAEENSVSKQNKSDYGLQRSEDSLEPKNKHCYFGLYDIFFFFYGLSDMNSNYF